MKKFLTAAVFMLSLSMMQSCAQPPETAKTPANKVESGNQTGTTPKSPTTETPSTPDPSKPNGTQPDPVEDDPMVDPVTPDPGKQEPSPEMADVKVNLVGGLDPTNSYIRFGEISGWAVNKDVLKETLAVNIYLDGDNKTGKKIATKANLSGPDDNNGSTHAFYIAVPTVYLDSKPHKVYAYAVVNNVEVVLSASVPYTLTFYSPKGGAAEAAYNKFGFNRCARCHAFDYPSLWRELAINANSGKPWAADANYLFERVKQKNSGGQHKNLSICTDGSCDLLKDWWKAEFN